jgi:CheY-like chemotaxis protein
MNDMFERLSVLLVDDSGFMISMMTEILRALEVGHIQTAKEGGTAVNLLRSVSRHDSAAANVLAYDLVITDYVMSPINGAMLLRWIRQSPDSPDRFLPVIMISGAVDSPKVHECRDLGATEFLAKPFSIQSISEHLLAIVDNPRPFLHTHDYFGPDRRRKTRPYSADERRVSTEKDIEIVYSGRKSRPENAKAQAFLYQLPNRLRDKIAGLNRGPLVIDPKIVKKAESQLDRMVGDYSEWVKGSLMQLRSACVRAKASDIRKREQYMVIINRIALDMRGQGTTFGYPLITEFAKSLYESTLAVDDVEDTMLNFIKDHINAISAVIRDQVKGMGGEIGQALVAGLEQARIKRAAANAMPLQATG